MFNYVIGGSLVRKYLLLHRTIGLGKVIECLRYF